MRLFSVKLIPTHPVSRQMQYAAMLHTPGMLTGMLDLVTASEPADVKRVIQVFTKVYTHSLRLLSEGEFDAGIYEARHPELSGVSRKLIEILKTSVDEGVTLQLVRYLECVAEAHLKYDLAKYPHIAQSTNPMTQLVFDTLIDFIGTPYVGGCPFYLAIRTLFSIAVYRDDLRSKVVTLATKLLETPPPNFYDHNVRGFKKVLQRSVFRLLKITKRDSNKEILINLLAKVGVPRRKLTKWAPRPSKKRPYPIDNKDKIDHGVKLQENKKSKAVSTSSF